MRRDAFFLMSAVGALWAAGVASGQCGPFLLHQFGVPDYVYEMEVRGGLLYAAAGSAGLLIMDVSDPSSPAVLTTDETTYANSVSIGEGLGFLSSNDLKIYDITDVTEPTLLGVLSLPSSIGAFELDGTLLYTRLGNSSIAIVDVASPSSPLVAGTEGTPGFARGVARSGDVAYVADQSGGVRVLSVADVGVCEVGCAADFNGDGSLDVLDFVAFQRAWVAGDAAADCDGDGAFGVLDFVCFQALFVGGC